MDHVEELLTSICAAYDFVVVDAGSYLDERSLTVLDRAEGVILPIYPEIAALKAAHLLIDYLTETGAIVAKTSFVLNNLFVARAAQAARRRERPRGPDRARPALRPVPLPEGRQRGHPDRARRRPDR